MKYCQASDTHDPNTTKSEVSDLDATRLLEPQVGDGVNNSQVALHTGEEVKQNLSQGGDSPDAVPYIHHLFELDKATTEEDCEPQDFIQLHDNRVIGEDVTVFCCSRGRGSLFPPLLVTQVEDQEGEREQEDVGDEESKIGKDAHSVTEALAEVKMEGGVGGEVRRNKGDVGKEGGVD